MAIKLIALDIDGTLTNQPDSVSERNRQAVKRAEEAGVVVALATGRGPIATRPIWRALDLHGASIQYGGAMIVDIDTERVLLMHELSPEVIREVLDYSASIGVHAQIYVDNVVVFEKPNAFADRYIALHRLPYEIDPDIRRKTYHNVPKVLAYCDTERQDEFLAQYRERFAGIAQVSRSSPGFIEINSLGITKATALEELADMLGVTREEVAAAGDNYLDQEMIEWAGLGVCVEDGASSVKAIADRIIPPSYEDGVATFIEQYVL
ncbi:MAG: HAD family phosphatase [Clostridiales bacterium]|nr:HAD family phosphatase [Clostridiales bacterium]